MVNATDVFPVGSSALYNAGTGFCVTTRHPRYDVPVIVTRQHTHTAKFLFVRDVATDEEFIVNVEHGLLRVSQ